MSGDSWRRAVVVRSSTCCIKPILSRPAAHRTLCPVRTLSDVLLRVAKLSRRGMARQRSRSSSWHFVEMRWIRMAICRNMKAQ